MKNELHDVVMFTSTVFRYCRLISYSLKKRHCVFPSLYWISIVSRIRRIQLELVKHDWRLLKVFLCLTHSWLFGVVVKTPDNQLVMSTNTGNFVLEKKGLD